MSCNCGKCNKCKECEPINHQFACLKPCPEICSETFDSRCVEVHCDTSSYKIIYGNSPQIINIPGCISQYEFNQYLLLLQTNPSCLSTGNNSRSVTYFYVQKVNPNNIKVHFNGIDVNYINPNYQVNKYQIVIKNIQNNTIYIIDVSPDPTNVYETNIGSPVILQGYTYEIKINTVTNDINNINNISTCSSVTHVIQM